MGRIRIAGLVFAVCLAACSGKETGAVGSSNQEPNSTTVCGGCSLPPVCGEPDVACSCGCAEGEILNGMVCTADGCLQALPPDASTGDAGRDAASDAATDAGSDMSVQDGGSDASTDAADDATADASTDMQPDMPMLRPRGTCASDADCNGSRCLNVPDISGGYRVCETLFDEPSSCQQDPNIFPIDECCKHDECTAQPGGSCGSNIMFFCGGALPVPQNICRYDECTSDADCTDTNTLGDVGTCIPPGAFGEPVSRCAYGTCQVDADCTNGTNGECTAFFAPCANRFTGFFCTYDESVCRVDADCPPPTMNFATSKCVPAAGEQTQCIEWLPPI